MPDVVIYGVGSALVVDVEASLARAGIALAAGIQNVPGEVYLLDRSRLMSLADVSPPLKEHPFLVPLFTPANRQRAAREAAGLGWTTAYSLIDPSVARLYAVDYQPRLYINSGCSLGAASQLDEFVLLNRGASLGHHARVGRFVSIGPGAVIAGKVTLGPGVTIGAGAVVLPERSIGANAIVGAGAVVTRDVPAHCLVVGNPARIVKQDVAGFGGASVL